MAYFRTILVLVQVLSVLANFDAQSAGVDMPVEGSPGGDDYYGEDPFFKDCKKDLQPLNKDLEEVFKKMVDEVTFKMDCDEVDAAEVLLVGGYSRFGDSHFNLYDNTTAFQDENDVKKWVANPESQWGDKLKEELKKVGINTGEVVFGCTWAPKEVFCFYRKQGENMVRLKEKLSELEEQQEKASELQMSERQQLTEKES